MAHMEVSNIFGSLRWYILSRILLETGQKTFSLAGSVRLKKLQRVIETKNC